MGYQRNVVLITVLLLFPICISASELIKRPVGKTGTVIVPDHFLRRWDPVTIFFAQDLGPAKGGPEDNPTQFVRMNPDHPGAFTWIDARTLQFKPADPWPPLARFTWRSAGTEFTLSTLMSAPVSTIPANNADRLPPVEAITLSFPEPLDVPSLQKMLTIELRPLPGINGGQRRWISQNFEIKNMERQNPSDQATYVINLKEAIPLGTRAIVKLRLSLEDTQESFTEISFATAEPFRLLSIGCYSHRYPVTPEGSHYSPEQAIKCEADGRTVVAEFSSMLRDMDPVAGRNLFRFTPVVDNLSFIVRGKTLEVAGNFAWDTLYRVAFVPGPITDTTGGVLEMNKGSELHLYFPRKPAYLKWAESEGVLERFGPQMVPVKGRGLERVDLRIYPIDPFDRSFWPFPDHAVVVDESLRPPGPGEEPKPYTASDADISEPELMKQLLNLGSPPVSSIVSLPLRKEGSAAAFGLDIEPHLTKLSGKNQPGTYLVGIRRLDVSNERSWMRVQVTDLSLTTVEEPFAVRFTVTSLSTSTPLAGAKIRVEGSLTERNETKWTTFAEGVTDSSGSFVWKAPGEHPRRNYVVNRIVVQNGNDVLVLDASKSPENYADNQWFPSKETWLQWAFQKLEGRGPEVQTLCHIFTERPVYRPEETVHIKGYLRRRDKGAFSLLPMDGFVVVNGPGNVEWRYPVTVNEYGSFYQAFTEKKTPTGEYSAHFEDKQRAIYGRVSFRIEAYRIPTFEVQLHSPDIAPLDHEFETTLTASYYAGGRVAAQPVQWRVTQFPYTWNPKTPQELSGFFYSSDGRFSSTGKFESTPRLEKQDTTNEEGSASLIVNPAIEPTSQPRSYVIEATVTGPDDQTVTATKSIKALPPFVLGLKVPRYLEHAKQIDPQVIVVGPDGKLLSDVEVTVRLFQRQWHSLLRASDFTDGVAHYTTDVVDEKVLEKKIVSAQEPVPIQMPISRSGVYVVELEAHDRLDRAQTIKIDLYAGGDEPVTWSKPVSPVFSVAQDRENYDPNDTAALVVKSPFQQAQALVIVEAPDGNRYEWLPVKGGAATFRLPIRNIYAPQIPVHFVLMRGRIPGVQPGPVDQTDLGKPTTMAATAWVKVNPVENQIDVKLQYPEKARPGQKIQVKIALNAVRSNDFSRYSSTGVKKDATKVATTNAPLPGEVTLWLVDQGVLALGKEQRLDPLPDFITAVRSHLSVRDTRNMAFGYLPFSENPGGEQQEDESSILERATVRKNFKTVPYYNPSILIGPDGTATVTVELPDNLTNFKIRAKAVSGPDRFGFATGHLAVRLPVIVQPSLPRFVRPGDSFTAVAIGRIVEGEGGPGAAEFKAEGVTLQGSSKKELNWIQNRAERIEFPVQVPTPAYNKFGNLMYNEVAFLVGVERKSDGAKDAFEVKIPIKDDRPKVTLRSLQDLQSGKSITLPLPNEAVRPGTLRRSLLVSDQAGLLRMASGLDFLLEYPYGCTEQKISKARAYIALRKFRDTLHQRGSEEELDRAVKEALDWIPSTIDSNGLVAYWPGSEGYVLLTSWTVQFVVEARNAGYPVDAKLLDQLTTSLERALRSDYSHFITGEALAERTWALSALADAGKFNSAYAAELARKSKYLDLEGVAQVLQSFSRTGEAASATTESLSEELWNGIVTRLYQGREIYGGLQDRRAIFSGMILPSETRTLAEISRAIARTQSKDPRLQILINALVTLGRDDGWGTTNANAAALLALTELLDPSFSGTSKNTITLRIGDQNRDLSIGPGTPAGYFVTTSDSPVQLTLQSGKSVTYRSDISYIPAADGTQMKANSAGFVVTRDMFLVRKDGPPEKTAFVQPGMKVEFSIGDVVEEHVQIVNPKDRNYVAVVVPLAAGVEPLNPNLATAPPEAKPAHDLTLSPTYAAYLDDQVAFYYNSLPKGTYDFYFRVHAATEGSFIQPAAQAEMMYDASVRGNSNGSRVEINHRDTETQR